MKIFRGKFGFSIRFICVFRLARIFIANLKMTTTKNHGVLTKKERKKEREGESERGGERDAQLIYKP